jgi:hypothetical protein
MKEITLEAGDVVKLASEDKLMTVESIDDKKVQCVWLTPALVPEYHDFSACALVLVKKHLHVRIALDDAVMEN